MPRLWTLLALAVCAQAQYPTKFSLELAERTDVKRALQYIDTHFDQQVAEWIKITEIPAPSTQEAARAAYVKAKFEKA